MSIRAQMENLLDEDEILLETPVKTRLGNLTRVLARLAKDAKIADGLLQGIVKIQARQEDLDESGYAAGNTYKAAAKKMLKMSKYGKNMFVRAYLIAVREGTKPDPEWAKKAGAKLAAKVRSELIDLSCCDIGL